MGNDRISLTELCEPALTELHQYKDETDKTLEHQSDCISELDEKVESISDKFIDDHRLITLLIVIVIFLGVTLIANNLSCRYRIHELEERLNQISSVQEVEDERNREGTEQDQTVPETNDGSSMETSVQTVL